MMNPAFSSGVSMPCLVLASTTLDNFKPSISRVLATCRGCLGLYARARTYIYRSLIPVFFLMREQITLSTLDTLSSKVKVIVFKGVLLSRVVSRVAVFCLGLVFSGEFQ